MAKSAPFITTGAAVLALALTGCAAGSPTTTVPQAALGHVHGLGFDPDSGGTYAATHNGVWLLPTEQLPASYPSQEAASIGAPRKVGGHTQDTMGFTVADGGELFASGHPGPDDQEDLGDPLGLVRSTDRANSWETVSLADVVDFHDLDAVPLPGGELRVYGYDATAGVVRVSDDGGANWQQNAAIELRDLAADAANPDRVYATTSNGFLVSDDRGATFDRVKGAPPLYLVDLLDDGGGFVGVDVTGQLWSSDSRSWVKHGMVEGTPEALTSVTGDDGEHWILIADARGIVATSDFGETVTVLTTNGG
ncbi:F510_1955 family glycosylhydrolase [Agromyces mediolanus]|uniref:Exo-alpha-sialidase n=1 Tax=Agromyces mediolanus TaxID=41986 RepID=A0A918FAR7_AGRME|nr:hypothetical protein [Agromyces mediolanus]GGR17230.1 hypothetical protein GCM10010196_07510 [Agromyces mediolanus]GLJ71637.1 hypothetical protein GCM10017583_08930 [Agromyces mediolanus]